jgi:hypothetical protein
MADPSSRQPAINRITRSRPRDSRGKPDSSSTEPSEWLLYRAHTPPLFELRVTNSPLLLLWCMLPRLPEAGGDDFAGEVLVGQQHPVSFLLQPGRSEGRRGRLR